MFLINEQAQNKIAKIIDQAVEKVLQEIASHGNEEGLTAALGHALMQQSLNEQDLSVGLKYRQHNKCTEEKYSGADGSFIVRVKTPDKFVEKASLFQAKLIGGSGDIRSLKMSKKDVSRLKEQSSNMLNHTKDAIALFYTHKNIYVVDALDYSTGLSTSRPLSKEHRLVTLGTYLGKWMTRCTKGDRNEDFVTKSKHMDGFKHGLTLDVISKLPSVLSEKDNVEAAWRKKSY